MPDAPAPRRGKARRVLRLALAAAALFAFADAFVYEPYFALHSERTQIVSKNWPESLGGLRIAVVSDIHAGGMPFEKWRVGRVVEEVNSLSPDIVLLLGDFVNGGFNLTSMPPEELAGILSGLRAPLGKFAVTGNHDEYAGAAGLTRALEGVGIRFLDSSSIRVDSPLGTFFVAGIPDMATSRFSLKKAFENVPPGAPCLFLTHEPELFPALPRKASAVFAGHTHGGQVRLPLVGSPLGMGAAAGQGRADGLFVNYLGIPMFVTRGVGTSTIPARFFCTPRVELITITGGGG